VMNRKWARAGNRNSSFVLSALLLVGVFVFAQDPPPQPATSPNLDQQLQTRLEFQRAAKQADDAERIKIESRACAALALRLLGHIEIDKFNWNGAIEHYSESLAILDSADGRFDLVLAYMKGQKFLEAEKEAQLLVNISPITTEAGRLSAELLSQKAMMKRRSRRFRIPYSFTQTSVRRIRWVRPC